jgi:hypothetical protein
MVDVRRDLASGYARLTGATRPPLPAPWPHTSRSALALPLLASCTARPALQARWYLQLPAEGQAATEAQWRVLIHNRGKDRITLHAASLLPDQTFDLRSEPFRPTLLEPGEPLVVHFKIRPRKDGKQMCALPTAVQVYLKPPLASRTRPAILPLAGLPSDIGDSFDHCDGQPDVGVHSMMEERSPPPAAQAPHQTHGRPSAHLQATHGARMMLMAAIDPDDITPQEPLDLLAELKGMTGNSG